MGQISGSLQDATSKVLNGTNGAWTKYELNIDGKRYQCKQDVWNHATAMGIGTYLHADVISQEKNGYTNWYCNAVYGENERGPSNAQERNPDNPAVKAMNAQAVSNGLVTELMRHESIARMAAVKHLNEAQVPNIGTTGFLMAAKALADFYLTGNLPGVTEAPTAPKPLIPQTAIDQPFDENDAQYDDSIPF